MADHVWIIPACGGFRPVAMANPAVSNDSSLINVPWDVQAFPAGASTPLVSADTSAMFVRGADNEPARLIESFARWTWQSTPNCAENKVALGARLMVGIPFSRFLLQFFNVPLETTGNWWLHPTTSPLFWNTVETWAKYRVNDPARFSAIRLSINGMQNSPQVPTGWGQHNLFPLPPGPWSPTWLGVTEFLHPEWTVAYARYQFPIPDPHAPSEWTERNLRTVLTFDGIDDPSISDAGDTQVDVEWFAIRLSDEYEPTPPEV